MAAAFVFSGALLPLVIARIADIYEVGGIGIGRGQLAFCVELADGRRAVLKLLAGLGSIGAVAVCVASRLVCGALRLGVAA